jgi:hypothetical protein
MILWIIVNTVWHAKQLNIDINYIIFRITHVGDIDGKIICMANHS